MRAGRQNYGVSSPPKNRRPLLVATTSTASTPSNVPTSICAPTSKSPAGRHGSREHNALVRNWLSRPVRCRRRSAFCCACYRAEQPGPALHGRPVDGAFPEILIELPRTHRDRWCATAARRKVQLCTTVTGHRFAGIVVDLRHSDLAAQNADGGFASHRTYSFSLLTGFEAVLSRRETRGRASAYPTNFRFIGVCARIVVIKKTPSKLNRRASVNCR